MRINSEILKFQVVSQKEFERIYRLKTPSEVLALLAIPEYPDFDLKTINDLMLMLDDIKDPGTWASSSSRSLVWHQADSLLARNSGRLQPKSGAGKYGFAGTG